MGLLSISELSCLIFTGITEKNNEEECTQEIFLGNKVMVNLMFWLLSAWVQCRSCATAVYHLVHRKSRVFVSAYLLTWKREITFLYDFWCTKVSSIQLIAFLFTLLYFSALSVDLQQLRPSPPSLGVSSAQKIFFVLLPVLLQENFSFSLHCINILLTTDLDLQLSPFYFLLVIVTHHFSLHVDFFY